jgi:hypothetical protein
MRYSFADLERLLQTNPEGYRTEVERLRVEDPERLDRFVEWLRRNLSKANDDESPLTKAEVNELSEHIATALGWPTRRVIAEALLRLHASLHEREEFEPVTPDEPSVKKPPRRFSSIRGLVLGLPKDPSPR